MIAELPKLPRETASVDADDLWLVPVTPDGRVTLRQSSSPAPATVEFRDEANTLVSPDELPTRAEDSNGRVISLDVAADGLSATIVPDGVGATQLTVTTLNDDGSTAQAKNAVSVVAGEPTHGINTWTPGPAPVVGRTPNPSPGTWASWRVRRLAARLRGYRPGHFLRPVLIGVALVVLAAVGYVFLSYALRSHPAAKSLHSVVSAFQRGDRATIDTSLRYEPPAQGVYELKGQGSERISFPPNSQSDGAVMPASVTYVADGCWRWHLDYNTAHWDEYDFCPRGNELVQTGYRNFQSWDFGTLTIKNLASFTCPSDAVVLADNPSAGQSLRWTCSGTNTAVSGKTTEKIATPVVGTVTLLIGRTTVNAVHEVEKITLSGVQKGTAVENWWFSAASGLPLRVERQITILTASPLGTITYNEDGSWQMASLQPRT